MENKMATVGPSLPHVQEQQVFLVIYNFNISLSVQTVELICALLMQMKEAQTIREYF